ncbi:hypothetical protein T03_13879 [Trichinella britovi]|uniref:Uncharacterized protein n=1 Tax=Trichinella britovi TaxID=45882 RepID=A0A0V1CFG6_TRIBR|nr:hypothetical protein T03_13879 [Trichinella britovi]
MFAPEAAQAGFTADFKILELNTFGGLYTKYLKLMQITYQSKLLPPLSLQVAVCAMQNIVKLKGTLLDCWGRPHLTLEKHVYKAGNSSKNSVHDGIKLTTATRTVMNSQQRSSTDFPPDI